MCFQPVTTFLKLCVGCRVQRLLCLSLLNMTDSAMEVSYLMHPLAVYCSRIFTTSIYPHPRPLRPCAEPQAGVSPPRRSPLIYTWYYICIYVYAWYENRPEYTSTHRPYRHTVASGVGDRGRNQCKTIFVWYTCVALPTKQKMWYGLQRQILLKPGFWSKSAPQIPFQGSSTPLRSFVGGVLPIEAFKGHTTPGRTQPSHDVGSYVVGLALVLLELEKSDAPRPCNCILVPPLCELQHSRSQIRQFSRQKSRW